MLDEVGLFRAVLIAACAHGHSEMLAEERLCVELSSESAIFRYGGYGRFGSFEQMASMVKPFAPERFGYPIAVDLGEIFLEHAERGARGLGNVGDRNLLKRVDPDEVKGGNDTSRCAKMVAR